MKRLFLLMLVGVFVSLTSSIYASVDLTPDTSINYSFDIDHPEVSDFDDATSNITIPDFYGLTSVEYCYDKVGSTETQTLQKLVLIDPGWNTLTIQGIDDRHICIICCVPLE